MQKQRLRTAVVGLGSAGRFHCEAIADAVPEMRLTAVVEAVSSVAAQTARTYGVPAFASCEELVRARVCDAVSIATPHTAHADGAVTCMNAGLHVLTEKPLAESVAHADRMIRAARANKVVFGCVFQKRFEPISVKALAIVRSGKLGKLTRATLVFRDFRTQAYYDSNTWRATWKGEGGGVLLNQAPHLLDIFALLAGMPEKVLGRMATRQHRIEVEDHAEALLTFPGGATGYVMCSTNEPTAGNYLELSGDKGRLILKNDSMELFTYKKALSSFSAHSPEMWGRPEVKGGAVAVPVRKIGHFSVLRNFSRHILYGDPLLCSGESAMASLELANAITLSHFTGREVCLPVNRTAYTRLLTGLQRKSRFVKGKVKVQRTTDPRMR